MKKTKVPYHIAIIMDGNRRWAKRHGLPTFFGHKRGYDNFRKIGDICLSRGVKILTLYALSTENFKRSKKEVNYLMRLLREAVTKHAKELNKKNIKLQILGRISKLPTTLQKTIKNAVALTKNNKKGILNICLNYGGHAETVDAVCAIIKDKIPFNKINENLFEKYLYARGIPPVDLLIRTGGEMRISNFLPWQLAYAELYFTNKYWPDFSEKDLDDAFNDYFSRERRMGK
jgi:undecaprenyl diphosphate synthase